MPNVNKVSSEALRQELIELLTGFEAKLRAGDVRQQVQGLIPANKKLCELGVSLVDETSIGSARARILAYLRRYPKTIIQGDELMVVAGISEYARRIRELRVEFGWPILSGQALRQSDIELDSEERRKAKADTYYLVEDYQDRDAAHRWNVANSIRKRGGAVKDRLLEYFRENVAKVVTGEELRYLAKNNSEWARRVRELRAEEGWPIMTKMSGRPDLPGGVYVLEEDRQAEVHDRKIPDTVRVAVLERDGFTCKKCGWNKDNNNAADRYRNFLELHHIKHFSDSGENTLENLITLCNMCHDDVHRGNITPEELFGLID